MFDLPIDFQESPIKQEIVFFSNRFLSFTPFSHSYSIPFAGIINLSPQEDYQAYSELPCSEEDRNKIFDLITTIGTKGKLDLLMNHKTRLERMGDEINAKVHPLKFLAVIFSNPNLKNYMNNIRGDYFKWTNFVHGLSKRINVEFKKGKVDRFIEDFSAQLNVSADDLRSFYKNGNKKDWEGFVDYLISH